MLFRLFLLSIITISSFTSVFANEVETGNIYTGTVTLSGEIEEIFTDKSNILLKSLIYSQGISTTIDRVLYLGDKTTYPLEKLKILQVDLKELIKQQDILLKRKKHSEKEINSIRDDLKKIVGDIRYEIFMFRDFLIKVSK